MRAAPATSMSKFPPTSPSQPVADHGIPEFSGFFAICSGIGLRPFAAGVGLGERTRPRVRRLTPRQPRPRAPPRVDPAWPGTRDFGMSPANRRRAGFPTGVPWSSRNGCERGCAPQATGFLLFGHNMPLHTARNHAPPIHSARTPERAMKSKSPAASPAR